MRMNNYLVHLWPSVGARSNNFLQFFVGHKFLLQTGLAAVAVLDLGDVLVLMQS